MTARPNTSVTIIDMSVAHFNMLELIKDLLPEEIKEDRLNAIAAEVIEDVVTEQVYMRSKWTEPRLYQSAITRTIMCREDIDEVSEILNLIHEILCVYLDTQANSEWAVYRCTVSPPREVDSEREVTSGVYHSPTNMYIHELGDYRIMQWEKANANLLSPNGALKKRVN